MGKKKSARRAEKLLRMSRRAYVASHPSTVVPDDWREDVDGVALVEALQALNQDEPERARWELDYGWSDRPIIVDHLTGLAAMYGGVSEAEQDLDDLLAGRMEIDVLNWVHLPSEARAIMDSGREQDRFIALTSDLFGNAVLDRWTGRVHPIGDHNDADRLLSEVRIWNTEPEEQFVECNEDDRPHWLHVREWMNVPEDEDLQPAALEPEAQSEMAPPQVTHAPLADDRPAVRVLVVSSRQWAWKGVVRELLQTYWNGVGNPPLVLMSSGSPYGAEAVARELAAAVDGVTYESIDDHSISPDKVDYAFAFISNESAGATAALNRLLVLGIPTHVMTETSAVVEDPWQDR